MRYDNVMIDLETLSTRADAVIVSIGAVKFNLTGEMSEECFYAVCDIAQPNRHIAPDTLAWWMKQEDLARGVFNEPQKHFLMDALIEYQAFFDHPDYMLWSNGADFDIPIINHALSSLELQSPVKFWNHRCHRTMKQMFKNVPQPVMEGTKHNALADAIQQAKHLIDIHKFMVEGKIMMPAKGFTAKR